MVSIASSTPPIWYRFRSVYAAACPSPSRMPPKGSLRSGPLGNHCRRNGPPLAEGPSGEPKSPRIPVGYPFHESRVFTRASNYLPRRWRFITPSAHGGGRRGQLFPFRERRASWDRDRWWVGVENDGSGRETDVPRGDGGVRCFPVRASSTFLHLLLLGLGGGYSSGHFPSSFVRGGGGYGTSHGHRHGW